MSLLLSYYGDDFTGSTDVMEALATAGLRTVLFLSPPTPAQLNEFPGLRAFGIAGGSRTLSPAEMARELPSAFQALRAGGATFVHYKVCSTFDSSPRLGSIGKAIEIGRRIFNNPCTPLVVGAPALGRYVVFGNLFARSGLDTEPSRLDRHPTMSRHPVTPMTEADLSMHLAKQTRLPIELFDVLKLEARDAPARFSALARDGIVLFDTLREAHLPVIGGLIASQVRKDEPLFCVGSSGLEYALVAHWRAGGCLERTAEEEGRGEKGGTRFSPRPPSSAVQRIIAVSGSCSPVTDRQISAATESGFQEIPLRPARLLSEKFRTLEIEATIKQAQLGLCQGRSLILHTSRGPTDDRLLRTKNRFRLNGLTAAQSQARGGWLLGDALGRILLGILERNQGISGTDPVKRVIVCGGDTSMRVARTLGIESLEFMAPMAPGSPLCLVRSSNSAVNGLEFVFKGGQVGTTDFFRRTLQNG